MNEIRIDETKLGEAMEIIEKAASLMAEGIADRTREPVRNWQGCNRI